MLNRPRRFAAMLLAALAVSTAAPAALAQKPRPPTYQERQKAKRLFNQAHLAYRRGDYEEAILKWEKSYELSGESLIFLSMANAYERLGGLASDNDERIEHLRQAHEYLVKWRKDAPKREHKELDSRIERLGERVAELEAEAKKRKEEEAERERLAKLVDEPKPEPDKGPTTQPGPDDSDDDRDVARIAGFTLIGVGGAAVITGVILDAVAASTRPAQDEACVEQDGRLLCSEAQRVDIENSNTMAIAGDVLWISGAVVAVGGAVLLFTLGGILDGDGEADSSATRIVPVVGPTGGGIWLDARF